MAFCVNCGKEHVAGVKFCSECGQTIQEAANSAEKTREHVYEGKIHVCPQCGEVIKSFSALCPSCGHEFRGTDTLTSSIAEMTSLLMLTKSGSEKDRIIRSFYIPNTKEDVMEFVLLAVTNLQSCDGCEEAWLSKLEQGRKKAQLLLADGPDAKYIENQYEQGLLAYKKARKAKRWKQVVDKAKKTGLWLIESAKKVGMWLARLFADHIKESKMLQGVLLIISGWIFTWIAMIGVIGIILILFGVVRLIDGIVSIWR